jgi:hypothetical protein
MSCYFDAEGLTEQDEEMLSEQEMYEINEEIELCCCALAEKVGLTAMKLVSNFLI